MRRLLPLLLVLSGLVAYQATHIHTSGTLPTNCTVGDIYLKTGSGVGFYTCTATNSWDGPLTTATAGNIQTLLDGISTTQGVIIYYNGTDWVALSPGTSGQFLKTNGASANPAWADSSGGGGNFTKIEETTPTGTSTSFSSLGSYTHLKIVYSARGDTSATSVGLNMTFNSDTGANYDDQRSQFTTTSSFANDVAANFIVIGVISAANATSNYAGSAEIVFPDYRGTTFFKTAIANGTYVTAQSSGSIFNRLFIGHWRSTNAVTSITITLNAGNFVSGSKFTLYGMN